MELNFRSQHSLNGTERTPTYIVVTFEGKNYRILTRQHKAHLQTARIWAVFWYLLGISLIGFSFILLFELKIVFALLVCFCCHLLFTIYAFRKREYFTNMIYYSSINLLVFMLCAIVLAFMEIKQIVIPLCFYILIQTFLSIKYMTNKSQMVAKFLLLLQALMIALKVDEKIQNSWKNVLFSHVVFFLFLSLCIIFMTAYLIYMKYIQNQQNLMKYKFAGALFIYFNTISFCLLSILPLLNLLVDVKIWISCFSMAFILVCLASFIYSYQKDIVIFFCTLNQIKSFNQIISFQPIQEISPQRQSITKSKTKKRQPLYLYKVSQNWVTTSAQKATQTEMQNPQVSNNEPKGSYSQMTDCTICLDKPAQVVWMPCGHLTVCMQCCSSMFQKRNMNCVLCKKSPQQIFVIDTLENNKQTSQADEKMKNLDVSIDDNDVSVISGSVILEFQKKNWSKKQLIGSSMKKQKQKGIKLSKKVVFTVLEGYNVKIV